MKVTLSNGVNVRQRNKMRLRVLLERKPFKFDKRRNLLVVKNEKQWTGKRWPIGSRSDGSYAN